MLHVFSILGVAVLFGQCSSATEANATKEFKLPATICTRDSPDYSTCLTRALQEAWPRFMEGFPELDFPRLDPLLFKNFKAAYNNGDLHAEFTLTHMYFVGYKTSKFLNVRPHFLDENFRLEFDLYIPLAYAFGHVKGAGRLNVFHVNGEGPFNVTMNGITTGWDLHGHVENDRWIVEHFYITTGTSVNTLIIDIHSLFQEKALGDIVQEFANTYWPALYRVVLPVTIETLDPIYTNIANRLFSKVPFSRIFP